MPRLDELVASFEELVGKIKEHREKGGNPDIDVCFQYLKYCFNSKLVCGYVDRF